ncbi:MAG: response regulator [Desulfovibrionaceae bacterium]|nr:response regulator [Desulfovibrionaceae bacterium]
MKKTSCRLLVLVFLLGVFACEEAAQTPQDELYPAYESYREIPGLTAEEIKAVEALRSEGRRFVYGMNLSAEAFYRDNGEVGGYAGLVCAWLSKLFDMPFEPAIYNWGDLLNGLESRDIDFSGELTASSRRRIRYFMTSAIAERSVKYLRIDGSEEISRIARTRPLRYAFLSDSAISEQVLALARHEVEAYFVQDYATAYRMLKTGEVDAFFDTGIAEAAFDSYGDVRAEYFFPLIYSPVSMSTQNPLLAPLISVVQKALQNGGSWQLARFYSQGYHEYLGHKLFAQLNGEEKEYVSGRVESGQTVRVAAEHDNYPSSFFNGHEGKWQGIAWDVLSAVSAFTGMRFERANPGRVDWPELMGMLESGEAQMITELVRSTEREKRFIWPDMAYQTDNFALLSRSDFPDISINEVSYVRVGLLKSTIYSHIFNEWFPGHTRVVECGSISQAVDALEKGEIDLLMASRSLLLSMTNYEERAGFKSNLAFDHTFESTFGFHKEEAALAAIVSKAMRLVDLRDISERWSHKVFDYRAKIAQAQRPWLIGSMTLLLCVITLLLVIFLRNRREGVRLEKLVRERTEQLRAVIGNYEGVIWSVDKDRIIRTFNGLYLKTIGVTPDFLEGKSLDLAKPKNRHLDVLENVDKALLHGLSQDWTGEIDGRMFHSHTSPIYDSAGQVSGVVGSTDDVTEVLRLQDDLHKAVEAAEAASRSKSDFLSNMSHEMRTPMNAIIGMTTIGKAAADMERKDYAFGKIQDASTHLLGVINDILDMSKIEAGKFEISLVEFDFEKMLQKVVNVVNFRVEEKRQSLAVHIDPELPPTLFGDDQRLAQVIANLLSNAVKFTPEDGNIHLGAYLASEEGDLACIRIEVSDSGIGISSEQQTKLFKSFQQAESSTTRRFGGTGLGLAISRRIVEMMGGEIWVKSELGRGATFGFTIRVKYSRLPMSATAAIPSGARVLVVDDQPEVLAIFQETAGRLGFGCEVAQNGEEALEKVRLEVYDMFFIDWRMPGMDGIDLAPRLREIHEKKSGAGKAVVVMISSTEWDSIEKEARAAGVDKFLAKPLFPSDIAECVGVCLGGRAASVHEDGEEAADLADNFEGRHVLLAEDVEINREIVMALLEPTCLAIDCAENGAEAVEMFIRNPELYDMIFMDVQMPEMDGYEATRRIRALDLPRAGEIPIIAMSANVFKEDVEKCLSAGMNDHVGKPLDLGVVIAKLHQYLES